MVIKDGGRFCVLAVSMAAIGLTAAPASAHARACGPVRTTRTVDGFLAALRADDAVAADRLWAKEPAFQWYSDARRMGQASEDRSTLRDHLRRLIADGRAPRGRRGRLHTSKDHKRSLGHFHGTLRAGRAFKGAVSCAGPRPLLIVWSSGG